MLKNGKTVSLLIPIYNEELTLSNLLKTLLTSKLFDEVICVNDASTDSSLEILKTFENQICLISYSENMGKGYAMAQGIKAAKSDLILFCDADFTSLTEHHLAVLLEPFEKDDVEVVIGQIIKSGPKLFLNKIWGERVYYKKDLLPLIKEMEESRFGVELLLNKRLENKKTVGVFMGNVMGNDLGHLNKHEKHAPFAAIQEYLGEGIEIAQQWLKFEKVEKEDKLVVASLRKVKDFMEFDKTIEKIKNTNLRLFLKDYVEKYLKIPPS